MRQRFGMGWVERTYQESWSDIGETFIVWVERTYQEVNGRIEKVKGW